MGSIKSEFGQPDKKLSAVCGLFCPACTVFIGCTEDRTRLVRLSERFGQPLEEMECHGCRSDKRNYFCRTRCKMTKCAAEKKIDFCMQCGEYPCAELRDFQVKMPHRIELWKSQERIKAVGYKTWYTEMVQHYSCSKCGTINSAYDLECRGCGKAPSCRYVELHWVEVQELASRMGP